MMRQESAIWFTDDRIAYPGLDFRAVLGRDTGEPLPRRTGGGGRNAWEEPMAQRPTTGRTRATRDSAGYWKANIRTIIGCLVVWAIVSFGFGILLRPILSGIGVGGTDLGFWFAQQGSILVFLILIFFYAWRMNRLDRQYGVEED